MGKTKPSAGNDSTPLTQRQEEILKQFDGEALTASEIAMNLRADIHGIRLHLRAIVAAKQLESTKVGRVVYFHEKGVRPPSNEKNDEEFGGMEGIPEDDSEHGDASGRGAANNEGSDEEGLSSAFMNGQRRKSPRSKDDEWNVEGSVDPGRAVPVYDQAEQNARALLAIQSETLNEHVPLIIQALKRMIDATKASADVTALYPEYEAQGIPRSILIRWFMAMKAHGETPETIVKKRPKTASDEQEKHERAIREAEEQARFASQESGLWRSPGYGVSHRLPDEEETERVKKKRTGAHRSKKSP